MANGVPWHCWVSEHMGEDATSGDILVWKSAHDHKMGPACSKWAGSRVAWLMVPTSGLRNFFLSFTRGSAHWVCEMGVGVSIDE